MKKIILAVIIFLLPGVSVTGKPLTLSQCRQLALEHNQKVQAAEKARLAAGENRKAALTNFFPSLDLNGTYLRLNDKIHLTTPSLSVPVMDVGSGGSQPSQYMLFVPEQKIDFGYTDNYFFNIGLAQPVFAGGKILESYRISTYAERLADAKKKKQLSEIYYHTDELYWRLVCLTEKKALAEKYRQLVGKHYQDLNNFFDEGLVTQNEVLKARVKYNEAELGLLKADDGLRLTRMALSQMTGLPLDTDIVAVDRLAFEPESVIDDNLSRMAVDRRPEVSMMKSGLDISRSMVRMARSRYFPSIMLKANYTYMNPNPYSSFDDSFGSDWNIELLCRFELFHWNDRGFGVAAALYQQQVGELNLQETEELIALDVQQAKFSLNESVKKVEMTAASQVQAEENLKVTTDHFEEGLVDSTEVLDAQTLWQQALSENIEARAEYRLNQTGLKKALGQLGED